MSLKSLLISLALCLLIAANSRMCAFAASPVDGEHVHFQLGQRDNTVYCGAFEGFGVEWDPFYFNDNNRRRGADEAGWRLITDRMKSLHVPIVRMMFQLTWCQHDSDLRQWDWDNTQVKSALRYLDFCQANDIRVVLTDWGWVMRPGDKQRLYTRPDDPRFSEGVAEYLNELIVRRHYTCIQYLVVGNEPDNELANWYSEPLYLAMYHNVDASLRRKNIRNRVKLMGPDMASHPQFMYDSIDGAKDVLDAYDFHRYASFDEVSNRNVADKWDGLYTHLDQWRAEINWRDPGGPRKPLLVTEMGAAGGSVDTQPKIDTFEYGLHMADYGTTLLTTRIQGRHRLDKPARYLLLRFERTDAMGHVALCRSAMAPSAVGASVFTSHSQRPARQRAHSGRLQRRFAFRCSACAAAGHWSGPAAAGIFLL